ncbi:MAG: hypothetical protein K6F58_02735 [Bacteroidales bacterium]|nr:hypothetical protein [Bacteroidales bacterium]
MENYEDNTPTGCCHVYSYGEDTPKLLLSRKDFIKAVQIIAWCSLHFNVEVLAFALMNSHFHFVLRGTQEDCQAFGEKVMQLLLLYVNRIRERKLYMPSAVMVSTKEITGERYLKTLICYVLRNPVDAGFKYDPREYEWSSARLYFSGNHERGRAFSELNVSERRRLSDRHEFPGDWTVSPEGIIDYENFVNYGMVESLFGGIRGMLVFMAIKRTEVEQMNYQCEKSNLNRLSDEELLNAAVELAAHSHLPRPERMDDGRKLLLAQRLRGKYGAGKKQLARILEIPVDIAERVLT